MSPYKDTIDWLESPQGEAWSRKFHRTNTNQTSLVSLKADNPWGGSEKMTTVWRSAPSPGLVL